MAFKPKGGKGGMGTHRDPIKPQDVGKSGTVVAWCGKCMTKRYIAGGFCLHCGGKA